MAWGQACGLARRAHTLEAASTPQMDFFAARGTVGLSRNIPNGFVPGTDIGCMSVLATIPPGILRGAALSKRPSTA